MKDSEFSNIVKQKVDGFEITPPTTMFDNIVANTAANDTGFNNKLKEHAAKFTVAPSDGLFDRISAANTAKNEIKQIEFAEIIKKQANTFKLEPSNALFDNIIIERNNLIMRRFALFALFGLLFFSVSSFFYWLANSTDALKDKTEIAFKDASMPSFKTTEDKKPVTSKATFSISTNNKITKVKKTYKQSTNSTSGYSSIVTHNTINQKRVALSAPFISLNNYITDKPTNEIPNVSVSTSIVDEVVNTNTEQLTETITKTDNSKAVSEQTVTPKTEETNNQVVNSTQQNTEKTVEVILPNKAITALPSKNKDEAKWAVGIFGTPQLLRSEYYSNNTEENWANEYLKTKEEYDKARFNYQAGLLVERKFNKKFSLISGVGISEIRFRELRILSNITPITAKTGSDIEISEKTIIKKSSFDVTLVYLEIPLLFQYNKQWNNFSFGVQGGLVYNLLTDANAIVYNSDTTNSSVVHGPKNKNLQRNIFYLSAALLAEYNPTKKVSVFFGPTYRRALNSLYDENYILSQKPNFYGLTMGMKYTF